MELLGSTLVSFANVFLSRMIMVFTICILVVRPVKWLRCFLLFIPLFFLPFVVQFLMLRFVFWYLFGESLAFFLYVWPFADMMLLVLSGFLFAKVAFGLADTFAIHTAITVVLLGLLFNYIGGFISMFFIENVANGLSFFGERIAAVGSGFVFSVVGLCIANRPQVHRYLHIKEGNVSMANVGMGIVFILIFAGSIVFLQRIGLIAMYGGGVMIIVAALVVQYWLYVGNEKRQGV